MAPDLRPQRFAHAGDFRRERVLIENTVGVNRDPIDRLALVARRQMTAVSSAGIEQFRKSHPQATVKFGASDALITEMPAARYTCTETDWCSESIDFETHFTLKRLHARGPTVENGAAIAVTEAGLIPLAASQPELEELDLRESAVTDKGLWELRALTELKRLDVRGASVTEKGVARLASALPYCKILR